jgi:predicted RNA polymerase sigma factor
LLQQISTQEEAKAAWQRVLDLAPGDKEATDALAALGGGS